MEMSIAAISGECEILIGGLSGFLVLSKWPLIGVVCFRFQTSDSN